jgi:tetratricopeptide (TPR) repeat protein
LAKVSTALAFIVALATCNSAWRIEESAERVRAALAAGDYAAARDLYQRAIRTVEQSSGPTATALVEPLAGLAATLSAAGQQAAAIEALNRAVAILRRNAGLYDLRHYPLLSQLTDLHSLTGDSKAAGAMLAYMERVSERTHGRQSVQHALSLSEIAAWQCRLGRFDSGRERYRRSIERLRAPRTRRDRWTSIAGRCSARIA